MNLLPWRRTVIDPPSDCMIFWQSGRPSPAWVPVAALAESALQNRSKTCGNWLSVSSQPEFESGGKSNQVMREMSD
jgi:hypothetical protein